MHFLVFNDGVPFGVHEFNEPITPSYFVYKMPKREKPYPFKTGKNHEYIYGFLFPLNEGEYDPTVNRHVAPKRFRDIANLLDLIFATESDDYGKVIRKVISLMKEDFCLVTDRGIQPRSSLVMTEIGTRRNTVLTPTRFTTASKLFMQMVNHSLIKHNLPLQEAFDSAIKTGIFGEYGRVITPQWWLDAKDRYGTSEVKVLPSFADQH